MVGRRDLLLPSPSRLREAFSKTCYFEYILPIAGEAFDKAARLLGLELRPNGGAALERLAQEGDPHRFQFSMPLKKYRDCNFSYAGTKTAVRLAVEEQLPEGPCDANRQACCPPLLSMLDHRTSLVASGQA